MRWSHCLSGCTARCASILRLRRDKNEGVCQSCWCCDEGAGDQLPKAIAWWRTCLKATQCLQWACERKGQVACRRVPARWRQDCASKRIRMLRDVQVTLQAKCEIYSAQSPSLQSSHGLAHFHGLTQYGSVVLSEWSIWARTKKYDWCNVFHVDDCVHARLHDDRLNFPGWKARFPERIGKQDVRSFTLLLSEDLVWVAIIHCSTNLVHPHHFLWNRIYSHASQFPHILGYDYLHCHYWSIFWLLDLIYSKESSRCYVIGSGHHHAFDACGRFLCQPRFNADMDESILIYSTLQILIQYLRSHRVWG